MAADPIIYCLEHLTDYYQFERLCSDIMSGTDFPNIEPLGGTGDGGRDALFLSRDNNTTIIFAYTVRSDWSKKLREDCSRIKEEGHSPDSLVFVCNSTLSAGNKDKAKSDTVENYGFTLEIYDLERIRVLLSGNLRYLIANHPSIFAPPWFQMKGGLSVAEARDTLLIDHIAADHATATWLARKLSLGGYKIWCYGTAPLAGENADSTVRTLIENRAVQYLPILSLEALSEPEFTSRCGAALSKNDFLLPCWAANLNEVASTSKLFQYEAARFDTSWTTGLNAVLRRLQSKGIAADLESDQGKSIALRAYIPEPVIKVMSERVFSNVFSVTVPKSVIVFELARDMDADELELLKRTWAFVKVSPSKFLAFEHPPESVPLKKMRNIPEYAWENYREYEGKNSINVVKELVRKSLDVACYRAELEFCADRKVIYFPDNNGARHRVRFQHLDGRNTHVAMTGEQQYGWGEHKSRFRYQLAPRFKVGRDEDGQWWVTTRIYVRVTDCSGILYQKKEVIRRRKSVTKGWWNKHWLARILGVMQALKPDPNDEFIEVGTGRRQVLVNTLPLEWECPVAIDVEAVGRIGSFQQEMARVKHADETEDNHPDFVEDPE